MYRIYKNYDTVLDFDGICLSLAEKQTCMNKNANILDNLLWNNQSFQVLIEFQCLLFLQNLQHKTDKNVYIFKTSTFWKVLHQNLYY